ncbi:MAG TPA: electron transfer flavoprotein subunit alpha/FixB family protein [Anaerolineae bacterium]|nr:electron transfer flavoprotein subunit alpha/FixB family protein [Anaerolineae bacterium]
MAHTILVWIENFKGHAAAISHEALGAARSIAEGGSVTAAVFGPRAAELAQEAIAFGGDRAVICDDATLADFRPEPTVALLAQIARDTSPDVILAGASTRGHEVSGALAVELNTGAISDVTALEVKDSQLVATHPVYAGKLLATIVPTRKPAIITTRARAFAKPEADAGRSGDVTRVAPVMNEEAIASKVIEFISEGAGEVSLGDARIIVSGGRGVGGPEGFQPVAELARALGGALGASRAAVDAGWIAYAHQVGQTGRTVSPDLYIACGISGAIQHQAGMRTAKLIVAINTDAEAPIFKLARYGIVGDLFKIIPALTAEFKRRLGK